MVEIDRYTHNMVNSILARGLEGIQRGQGLVVSGAERISKSFSPDGDSDDAVTGVIETKQGTNLVKASLAIISAEDEMMGAILDILG